MPVVVRPALAHSVHAVPATDPLGDRPEVVAVEETDQRTTTYSENGAGTPVDVVEAGGGGGAGNRVQRFLHGFFLPQNYPDTVSSEYPQYRRWVSVQQFAGGALDFLATQGVLAGLGKHFSIPTVATISYFSMNALDSFGQMAGASIARHVDLDPKKWYAGAETIMPTARLALASISLMPGAFLAVAPLGNACKAFANTINGAAEANIDLHNSMGLNLGEMKAKNGNQNMVSNGLGTLLGIGISAAAHRLAGNAGTVIAAAGLALVEMTAARMAARSLRLHDLTETQVRRLAHYQLETDVVANPDALPRRLPNGGPRLELGSGLRQMAADRNRFDNLRGLYANDRYMLDYDGQTIRMALHNNSTPEDQANALYQAQLLSELVTSPGYQRAAKTLTAEQATLAAVQASYAATPRDFHAYLLDLKARGWETNRISTTAAAVRVRWRPVATAAPTPMTLAEFRKLMA